MTRTPSGSPDRTDTPHPSASVVLLRPAPVGFEVFLLRRHGRSRFMANHHVFPGGRVDPADRDDAIAARCVGLDRAAAGRILGIADGAAALGIVVAALRETYEEAGVLLAAPANQPDAPLPAGTQAALSACRRDVQQQPGRFLQVLRAHDLVLRCDRLAYWDHWITPRIEPRRYDAHFFVARVPAAQYAEHDRRETTAGRWWAPTEVLQAYYRRELDLAPPQLHILTDLAARSTIEAVEQAARGRGPIAPVLPEVRLSGGVVELLLPGDEAYPGPHAEPGRRRRARLLDGRWHLEPGGAALSPDGAGSDPAR